MPACSYNGETDLGVKGYPVKPHAIISLAAIFCLTASGARPERIYQAMAQTPLAKAKATAKAVGQNPLSSGQPVEFSFAAVANPTLIAGTNSFTISVPAGATQLDIKLSAVSVADVDLYVRLGQNITLANGQVLADFSAETYSVDEVVSLSGSQLQAGIYYIAIGVFSPGVPVEAIISATISGTVPTNALAGSQFVAGAGWATSLFVSNLSASAEQFTVHFYSDDGSPALVAIEGKGTVDTFLGTVQPGETAVYDTSDASALKVCWAVVIPATPGANRLSGFNVFRYRQTGQSDSEAIVPLISTLGQEYVVLYDNINGFQTGLAIANASSLAPMNVQVTVRDSRGATAGTYNQVLAPLGHIALILSQSFGATANQRGSMRIVADQPGLSALGLRFNPNGAFTSFPALTATDMQ